MADIHRGLQEAAVALSVHTHFGSCCATALAPMFLRRGAWRGPEPAHQDFQFTSGAVEVKATAAKQPQSVRITSERQLDDNGSMNLVQLAPDRLRIKIRGSL